MRETVFCRNIFRKCCDKTGFCCRIEPVESSTMFDPVKPEVPPRLLKELVAAGSVGNVIVKGYPDGWLITLLVGMSERVVGTARGGPRYFKTQDAAAAAIYEAGLANYSVSLANGIPKTRARAPHSDANH